VECGRSIDRGEVYVRTSQKWEGEVSTSVWCADCDAWATALCAAQRIVCDCSGWPIGDLWIEIADFCHEHLGYHPSWEEDEDTVHFSPDPKLANVSFRVDDGVGY
jgi:hypothetical protein